MHSTYTVFATTWSKCRLKNAFRRIYSHREPTACRFLIGICIDYIPGNMLYIVCIVCRCIGNYTYCIVRFLNFLLKFDSTYSLLSYYTKLIL